jgi:hypothetical protein
MFVAKCLIRDASQGVNYKFSTQANPSPASLRATFRLLTCGYLGQPTLASRPCVVLCALLHHKLEAALPLSSSAKAKRRYLHANQRRLGPAGREIGGRRRCWACQSRLVRCAVGQRGHCNRWRVVPKGCSAIPGTGAVWVYARTNDVWAQQGSKLIGTGAVNGTVGARLGYSAALSADGSTAIVGG